MSNAAATLQLPRRLRKANDYIDLKSFKPPGALFDEFWREGELALMFGPAGVGKSLLAVQIAEALARGRTIEGFEMSATRRNVLYVDLVLSDAQWIMRYSHEVRGGRRRAYRFSKGFHRDRPSKDERLIDWLRASIAAEGIRVVVIDDLSVISQSSDGTRDTLELMRDLREMVRELGLSVLVLADSQPFIYQRQDAERDLRSRRVLCGLADSVFAIERPSSSDRRYLVQTRAQAGEPVWTHRSPVRLILNARDDGSIGFEREEMTPDERDLICRIKAMHDAGQTFRAIADSLDMTKTTVARLHGKWTPRLEPPKEKEPEAAEYVPRFPEAYDGEHTDNYLASIGMSPVWREEYKQKPAANGSSPPEEGAGSDSPHAQAEVAPAADDEVVGAVAEEEALPETRVRAGPTPHKIGLDGYGREILIEKEGHLGLPDIWYWLDKQGIWRRHERVGFTINITRLVRGPGP